jgi:hypothetical protein
MMQEEQTTPVNQLAPATPNRVQSVVEKTPPVLLEKKVSLTETLTDMISMLANHKTSKKH